MSTQANMAARYEREIPEGYEARIEGNKVVIELKKSEDERIRKFLIQHVSEWIGCIEHDLKLSSKDVESEEELAMFKAGLAYLEKQKEQKSAEWSEEDDSMWADVLESFDALRDYVKDNPVISNGAAKEMVGEIDSQIEWLRETITRINYH